MRILVVDDEKDMQRLFQQRFRKEIKNDTISFVFAFSGEEALNVLKEIDHKAILILSDINMPGMSGLELLEQIKATYLNPSPVVMMITAYGDEHNKRTSNSLGADDFLTKPIDFSLLKNKLKNLA